MAAGTGTRPERRKRIIEADVLGAASGRQTGRLSPSALVSLGVHAIAALALLWLLSIPLPFNSWLRPDRSAKPQEERVAFFQLPSGQVAATPGRSGGNGREGSAERARPAAPLVAPTTVPSTLPPATPGARAAERGGTGEIVGEGGPTRGIRPSYADPRVWAPGPAVAATPKTPAQRLDSSLVSRIQAHNDSLVANTYQPNKFERGDWTVGKGDGKFGIDQKFIRLGKISIPTALLGLLPINQTGNPIAYERNKQMAAMRAEILEHAQISMNEDEFRKAVKAIRERKERERSKARDKGEGRVVAPADPSERE